MNRKLALSFLRGLPPWRLPFLLPGERLPGSPMQEHRKSMLDDPRYNAALGVQGIVQRDELLCQLVFRVEVDHWPGRFV